MELQQTDIDLLYEYHLQVQKKYRQETIELLKNKEFKKLTHSVRYIKRIPMAVVIDNPDLESVIESLQTIKKEAKDDESNYRVSGCYEEEKDENLLFVTYTKFQIEEEELCERLAKTFAKSAIWKVKYQPNGRDAKNTLELLQKLKNKENV